MSEMIQSMPTTGQLTLEQIDFYHAFGYVVFKQLFTPDEVAEIRKEFDHAMAMQYPHKPFDGTQRHWTMMLEGDTPFFCRLLEDPRFMNPAKQLYGEDALGVGVDANRYVGNTGWHRDTMTTLQYGVKYAFYLEPVGANNGALRVIPSSHRYPNDTTFGELMRKFSIAQVPAQVIDSQPGDVVAFDLRTWHASFGGSNDRRMCTVVYYGNPKNHAEEQALVEQGRLNPRISYKEFGCTRQYLYSRAWLDNPGRNPDRQRWIGRLNELQYFDLPGMAENGPVYAG